MSNNFPPQDDFMSGYQNNGAPSGFDDPAEGFPPNGFDDEMVGVSADSSSDSGQHVAVVWVTENWKKVAGIGGVLLIGWFLFQTFGGDDGSSEPTIIATENSVVASVPEKMEVETPSQIVIYSIPSTVIDATIGANSPVEFGSEHNAVHLRVMLDSDSALSVYQQYVNGKQIPLLVADAGAITFETIIPVTDGKVVLSSSAAVGMEVQVVAGYNDLSLERPPTVSPATVTPAATVEDSISPATTVTSAVTSVPATTVAEGPTTTVAEGS